MGICLSGGGIRAAAFGLGALQSFGRHGLLYGARRAKYLTAVSGGSYVATAFALVAKDYFSPSPQLPDSAPFAHGSPEEQYLRDHTKYLTHGRFGVAAVVWRVLLGVLLNVTMFVIALSVIGFPLGYLYRRIWPSLQAGCPRHCPTKTSFAVSGWITSGVLLALSAAVLLGFAWLAFNHRSTFTRKFFGFSSGLLLAAAGLAALLFIAFPTVIHLARPPFGVGGLTKPGYAHDSKVVTGSVGTAGILGVIVAWITAAKRFLASTNPLEAGTVGRLRAFATKHRKFVINLVATIAGPVLVIFILLYLAYWASAYSPLRHGVGQGLFRGWVVALFCLAVLWLRADVTAWSLFPFYRRRLSSAFVVERRPANLDDEPTASQVDGVVAHERNYATPCWLSDYQSDEIPEVIICAAANISTYGETPTGTHVTSFTFSSRQIGGPLVGAASTSDYELALRPRAAREATGKGIPLKVPPTEPQARFVTFPSAMAISGAAFAPSMGKMTRGPYRFVIALLNLRLGVWVPNPRYLKHFANRFAHPLLPRPQYFVREMLGLNYIDAPFLYVTDGGHYDNLGLVELLRRRCKEIWCIDASGDKIDTFDTLGGALRQAESELQVRVDIEPFKDMAPTDTKPSADGVRYVKSPHCTGKIHYPRAPGHSASEAFTGTLHYVKLGVPKEAPWSVRSYASAHSEFPCDPTLDQLYDADRFEAYRELGAFSVDEAVTSSNSRAGKSDALLAPENHKNR
ncbi:MAG: hypothetical protein ACHQFZ_02210 [Acidimicrobiales bacterium]